MAFSLEATFGVNTTNVRAELKTLRRDLDKFVEGFAKIGAGMAVGAFVALGKEAIDLAGSLSDTAQNIGINVESLQALQAQHKRNGVSNEELVKSLQKTKAAVIDAAQGNEKAEAAFRTLGLSAKELIALPLDQQYAAIAGAVAEAEDQTAAYAAVSTILGEKVGPKLMGSLRDLGEQGLPGVSKAAAEAGQVMSAETIVALDRAGDAIDDFKKRITVAVGNILVNFRSEEGITLLGLKLMKVAAEFGGSILDFFTEAGSMAYAVLRGSFRGVLNYLQDGFVDVVQGIAALINRVLPKNFEINVGNLEEFRSSGKSIGDEITEAIAQTSPSTFKKDFGDVWQESIDDMQAAVDRLNEVDLGEEADKLRAAGDAVETSIGSGSDDLEDAGDVVEESISDAAEEIADSAKELYQAMNRVGADYSEQSTAALQGVAARLRSNRDSAALDTSYNSAFTPGAKSPLLSVYQTELTAVERELAYRKRIQDITARYGEDAARAQFGDRPVDSALREMQSDTKRSTVALEKLANGLAAQGWIPRT